MPETRRSAVVLLSGGIDSTVAFALTAREVDVYALTVDYGQRHRRELESARAVAVDLGAQEHRAVRVDPALFTNTPLVDPAAAVPHRSLDAIAADRTPATYVPARNTILLALGLAYAEQVGADRIMIGATAEDQTGYPDCRPAFLDAWTAMSRLGTRNGATAVAPLADLTKAEVIERGWDLGVDFSLTWSCYDPQPAGPCRRCDACIVRAAGFANAGMTDPAVTP